MSFLLTLWRERLVNVLVHHSSNAFPVISQYSKFVAFPHLKVNQASVCEAPLEITSFKKIAKFSHQNQRKMVICADHGKHHGHEWNRSAPQRCDSTWHWRFCGPNDLSYPMLFCCFCHLKKMKYSSIRFNKILKCIVHKIVLEALCLDFTSYPMEVYLLQCHNHLQPHVGSILQGLALTAWKMAKWQSFTKLEIFRTEEPKNRTSTNACTKAAMPGKWCRDADGRTDNKASSSNHTQVDIDEDQNTSLA